MKQIKTVLSTADDSAEFDRVVNKLLAEGWDLKCRKVVGVEGAPSEAFKVPVIRSLYAELERFIPDRPEEITE